VRRCQVLPLATPLETIVNVSNSRKSSGSILSSKLEGLRSGWVTVSSLFQTCGHEYRALRFGVRIHLVPAASTMREAEVTMFEKNVIGRKERAWLDHKLRQFGPNATLCGRVDLEKGCQVTCATSTVELTIWYAHCRMSCQRRRKDSAQSTLR
jgi:hypothetical protein